MKKTLAMLLVVVLAALSMAVVMAYEYTPEYAPAYDCCEEYELAQPRARWWVEPPPHICNGWSEQHWIITYEWFRCWCCGVLFPQEVSRFYIWIHHPCSTCNMFN